MLQRWPRINSQWFKFFKAFRQQITGKCSASMSCVHDHRWWTVRELEDLWSSRTRDSQVLTENLGVDCNQHSDISIFRCHVHVTCSQDSLGNFLWLWLWVCDCVWVCDTSFICCFLHHRNLHHKSMTFVSKYQHNMRGKMSNKYLSAHSACHVALSTQKPCNHTLYESSHSTHCIYINFGCQNKCVHWLRTLHFAAICFLKIDISKSTS